MTDIPEPDWENLPWPEPYQPEPYRPKMRIVRRERDDAHDDIPAPSHVGRRPDTTPDDLADRIAAERNGEITAIRLPWWKLNRAVGFGLYPGNVTVASGTPGASKSYFALNVLTAAGKAGVKWKLLPLEDILRFVEDEAGRSNLVCIDPVSQITFDRDGRDYRGQADFMRRLVALAASTQIHVVLIAHTVKQYSRGGDGANVTQGSAMFDRLSHNVLSIMRHNPPIEDQVYSAFIPTVAHQLTIGIIKSRNGKTGEAFAFDLDESGPTLKEHGLIKTEAVKRKAGR